ncbi:feruloyl esterase-like protein B precursor [Xylariales sp. PMI_506]|nr:feruloyl esterase-like protein B precursor [Xylariales sp. PMI_506]
MMGSTLGFKALATAAILATVHCLTLDDICTVSYAQEALPAAGFYPGITIDSSSVTTALTSDYEVSSEWYPNATITYCNVTFAYSHDGLADDLVHVTYWIPAPDEFQNRYVSTGGGGLAINSGSSYIPTGIIVGAVSGITDGGFGSFNTQWDAAFLEANGTINWQATYMFGYQAHHELAILGKEFAKNLYSVPSTTKVYSYYQGCSEGGREGWSQLQRFADQFDGAAIGAPAFRYGQQQVNHLTSNVIEQTLDYYPPSCELDAIVNLTIAACDPLDGKTDGVVSRSDLCKLSYNISEALGTPYSCAAAAATFLSPATPEQNGTVTAKGIAVAQAILDGLVDSEGQLVYFSYQPGASFVDAQTSYDADTDSWVLDISGLGGEWVARFLELEDESNLPSLANVTSDTLKNWMSLGMQRYYDSLQTTYPDLTDLQNAGGKVIHIHGEQDNSIPTASSVRYYESVRSIMYGGLSYNASTAAMDDFYRLFLVPGGAHCGTNTDQPNGPWPQTTLQTVIQWVEGGVAPTTLNGTGEIDTICRWPLRPLWTDNGSDFSCVYDQASIDSWIYDLDAWKVPVY